MQLRLLSQIVARFKTNLHVCSDSLNLSADESLKIGASKGQISDSFAIFSKDFFSLFCSNLMP